MDKLTALTVFQRVAETENFSRAAEGLGMSKSVVSKQVSALEESLGVKLLYRTTRRVSLTDAGRAYLERTRRVLEELEEADNAVSALSAEIKGRLKINAPLTFGIQHLGPALCDFLNAHPKLALDVDLADRFVDVVEEGYDLVIRIGALADSSLIARKLADSRMILSAAPGYLARHGTPQTPDDLTRHAGLHYRHERQARGWPLKSATGEETVVQVPGSFAANNGDLLLRAAVGGLGIARLPTFIVAEAMAAGALTPVLPGWAPPTAGIWAVYPPNRHLSAKVRALIDHLSGRFGDPPYWDAKIG